MSLHLSWLVLMDEEYRTRFPNATRLLKSVYDHPTTRKLSPVSPEHLSIYLRAAPPSSPPLVPRCATSACAHLPKRVTPPPFQNHTFTPPTKRYTPAPSGPAWGASSDQNPLKGLGDIMRPPWSGARARAAFNEFFETKGHTYWASSSVRKNI